MPIERDPSKVLALPDDDFFRWRADVREILAGHGGDARLSALYEASGREFDARAARAWSAGRDR
jgi:hypothetical protein